jgi:hypothetical protein
LGASTSRAAESVKSRFHCYDIIYFVDIAQGKGNMTTYFLRGKDGFNLPLPTPDMAASLEDHEFK